MKKNPFPVMNAKSILNDPETNVNKKSQTKKFWMGLI